MEEGSMSRLELEEDDLNYIRFGRCPVIKKSDGKICGRELHYVTGNTDKRVYYPTCLTYHYRVPYHDSRYRDLADKYHEFVYERSGRKEYDLEARIATYNEWLGRNYEIFCEEELDKEEAYMRWCMDEYGEYERREYNLKLHYIDVDVDVNDELPPLSRVLQFRRR
jgi:hypothetical protein